MPTHVPAICTGQQSAIPSLPPSHPKALDPQENRDPADLIPKLSFWAEAIEVQVPVICTGEERLMVSLKPSCPCLLYPQPKSDPSVLSASELGSFDELMDTDDQEPLSP